RNLELIDPFIHEALKVFTSEIEALGIPLSTPMNMLKCIIEGSNHASSHLHDLVSPS
ncbi:unnamed protein product, partial [marine sediment metagenome]